MVWWDFKCTCPDCAPHLHGVNYGKNPDLPEFEPGPVFPETQAPTPKAKSMSKDAYNLARISRGEEGKTAYFYFPDMKMAPKTIVWLWSDGFVSVHEKKPGSPKVLETSKEWWDSHVLNAPWPSTELIEDLYNDVFIPRQTSTHRYQMIENEKKYHKITSKNLLDDKQFVSKMVEHMHDASKVIDLIDEWTNQTKAKKVATQKKVKALMDKVESPPVKNKIKFVLEEELEEIEVYEEDDVYDPFEVPVAEAEKKLSDVLKAQSKVYVTKLDENGNAVGDPVKVGGIAYNPSWSTNINVMKNLNGSYTVIQPATMNWNSF